MGLPNRHPQEEEQESALWKAAKHQTKRQVRKQGRKVAKKFAKKGAKLAAVAIKRGLVVLAKMLVTFLAGIGLPVILITMAVIVCLIIVFTLSAIFFGNGTDLDSTSQELYEYMVESAEGTVDMSKPEQIPYRVPEQLIASAVQIAAGSEIIKSEDEAKDLIRKMANDLAPSFEYSGFNEWTEVQETVCRDGDCKEGKVVKKNNNVNKLTSIHAWNGQVTNTYSGQTTAWQTTEEVTEEDGVEVKTITKTRRKTFQVSSTSSQDYSGLDQVLNSYDYGMQDKKLTEAFYIESASFSEEPLPPMNYILWLEGGDLGSGTIGIGTGFNGTIIPGDGVPTQYMPIYRSAEKKYGVDWNYLAAVHYVETGFSTHETMVSSVGAQGHMQFMPATWAGWTYNIGGGLVSSSLDITNLNVIRKGNGYGVDGNGDGKADPWDVEDAIHTAASYLSKSGFQTDKRKAIFNYNHASWYVDKVVAAATRFGNEATYKPDENMPAVTEGSFMKPSKGYLSSSYGKRSGGMHHGLDIGNGGVSTPIVAAANGKVSRSYYSTSYGNVVFIKHNINGTAYETVYAHMKNRAVSTGQTVSKGDYLGNMGNTGGSDGMHLHFEIHKGSWNSKKSNSLNPVLFISL